jgi:hypothetical protein
VGVDLITREDGYQLGMGRDSRHLSGELPTTEVEGTTSGGRPAGIRSNKMSGKRMSKQ